MKYLPFGRSGLRVSEVALGTGTFGTRLSSGSDRDECRAVFDAFTDAGGNFIDCADAYQGGEAESILGDFVRADRGSFAIATKFTTGLIAPSLMKTGNSRKAMVHSLEASLKRLGTDYVDVFWVHFPDHVTPIDEILRGFDDLVRQGKVHYIGLSDFPAWRVAGAKVMADLRGLAPVSAVQIEYSLAERSAERELIPMAAAHELAAMVWSPLGGGLLSGKYRRGQAGRRDSGAGAGSVRSLAADREAAVLDAVEAIAVELGATMPQVAIAWLRARRSETQATLVPILGARTPAQLADNLGALSIELDPAQMARLDAASAIEPGFPHEFIHSEGLLQTQSGGQWENLVRQRPVA